MPTQSVLPSAKIIPPKYDFVNNLGVGFDVLVLGVWATASLGYALTIGRKRGPILLLSTYAGLALSSVVSTLDLGSVLGQAEKSDYFMFLLFLLGAVLAFVALIRTVSRHAHIHSSKEGTMLLGALEVGAFMSTAGTLLPSDLQKMIGGFAGTLFVTSSMNAIWLILPLFVLLIGEYSRND